MDKKLPILYTSAYFAESACTEPKSVFRAKDLPVNNRSCERSGFARVSVSNQSGPKS